MQRAAREIGKQSGQQHRQRLGRSMIIQYSTLCGIRLLVLGHQLWGIRNTYRTLEMAGRLPVMPKPLWIVCSGASGASESVKVMSSGSSHENDISSVLTSGDHGKCPMFPAHRPAAGIAGAPRGRPLGQFISAPSKGLRRRSGVRLKAETKQGRVGGRRQQIGAGISSQ